MSAKKLRSVQDLMSAELPASQPAAEEMPAQEGPPRETIQASATPATNPEPSPIPAYRQPKATTADDRLAVILPASVVEQVKIRAAVERTTLRVVVLRALRSIGIDVPADELVDRRAEANARRR